MSSLNSKQENLIQEIYDSYKCICNWSTNKLNNLLTTQVSASLSVKTRIEQQQNICLKKPKLLYEQLRTITIRIFHQNMLNTFQMKKRLSKDWWDYSRMQKSHTVYNKFNPEYEIIRVQQCPDKKIENKRYSSCRLLYPIKITISDSKKMLEDCTQKTLIVVTKPFTNKG